MGHERAPALGALTISYERQNSENEPATDAFTLVGSILHGRLMLLSHVKAKPFDADQIAELKKDGLLKPDGRVDRRPSPTTSWGKVSC